MTEAARAAAELADRLRIPRHTWIREALEGYAAAKTAQANKDREQALRLLDEQAARFREQTAELRTQTKRVIDMILASVVNGTHGPTIPPETARAIEALLADSGQAPHETVTSAVSGLDTRAATPPSNPLKPVERAVGQPADSGQAVEETR